ncbi:MAG: hypothetical protein AUI57_09020 [Candidatus Rokubacteria bacterium 13_1_40CM_2_68_8]|nr:MAG: hypothetical protein AUI57_09020 [Candidatus Rokubacteria bacterium 13_1_40CM_2_68_8]
MGRTLPRDFYDAEYPFDADIETPNLARLWRALRELEPLAGTTLLDLGCGVGWATHLAIVRGGVREGVGLDFSRRPLELGRRHTPGALWVHADGTALPLKDAAFDRVFSFGSMEHFPDVRRGFDEAVRVLRRGGLMVAVVPNFYVHTDQPLEFRASYRGWKRLVEAAGFQILRVKTDRGPAILKNRKPVRILTRLVLRLLSLIPPLRYQFVFVLRKP